MARKSPNKERCIIEDCSREVLHHGLCRGCYQAASRRVRAGETTWADLEQKGLARPHEIKCTSPFTRAYRRVAKK